MSVLYQYFTISEYNRFLLQHFSYLSLIIFYIILYNFYFDDFVNDFIFNNVQFNFYLN